MIVGIGVDLVEMQRVERLVVEYGERFAARVLTQREIDAYRHSSRPIAYLASRFAAKEALSKALGTGLRHPVTLHAISVVSDEIGRPELRFHAELPAYLQRRGVGQAHLSLAHEHGMACAMVVLESTQ